MERGERDFPGASGFGEGVFPAEGGVEKTAFPGRGGQHGVVEKEIIFN